MILSSTPNIQTQFVLDPGVFPDVIILGQTYGRPFLDHIFYLTRTYAFYLHRQRLIKLGRWPPGSGPAKKKSNFYTFDNLTNLSCVTGTAVHDDVRQDGSDEESSAINVNTAPGAQGVGAGDVPPPCAAAVGVLDVYNIF